MPTDTASHIENPYAPPQADVESFAAAAHEGDGLWRWGHLLVMRKDAELPDVCLLTGEPGTRRLKRVIGWYHPALLLLILVNVLLFAIVAALVRKKARLSLALSERIATRRRRAMIGGWALFLAALGGVYAIGADLLTPQLSGIGAMACLLAMLVAALWGSIGCRLVSARRMTKSFIWLKGVHPDFLAGLPEWQTGFKAPS